MKFREIFRFEFTYQLHRIWTWLFFITLVAIAFLITRDGTLAEALHDEFFINSPFAIAKTTVACNLIWLLIAAALTGEAAARDIATGIHPLIYSAPINKMQYLGGRFAATFTLHALILLGAQTGILLAIYLPGIDAELIGPFRPAAYLTSFAFIALPNAFIATALQFLLANRSGRPMAAYLGSFLLFFMSYIVGLFLLFQGRQDLANLLDPIGVHFILSELSHLWTTVEKSWRLLSLQGTVLNNRLIWSSVGLVCITYTYLRFRFSHRVVTSFKFEVPNFKFRKNSDPKELPTNQSEIQNQPAVKPTFGFSMQVRQTILITWTSFKAISTSWAGLFLLTFVPLVTVLVVIDQMESNGVPFIPNTIRVLSELTGPISAEMSRWIIIPLLIVYFTGELIWRERDARVAEITDTMPGSEWAPFLGKFLGLSLVLALSTAQLITAGVVAQTILGYYNFEMALYLKIMFGLQLPEYLLFTVLALTLHVLVNQKYIGHLVAIISYVFFIALATMLGIEHNLLIYGGGPGWSYTDMSGFGPSLAPWLWFKLYWTACALLLAVAGRLLWVRGKEKSFHARIRSARFRFADATVWTGSIAIVIMLLLGGYIFYNTNVLNNYQTPSAITGKQAAYEHQYSRYKNVQQPQLTHAILRVEIYPKQQSAKIQGTYNLINISNQPIDTIHVATASRVEVTSLQFSQPAKKIVMDETLHHDIYKLTNPLQPCDSLQLTFTVKVEQHGFTESGVDNSVVANGSFFGIQNWLPAIGYQQSRELTSAGDRRKYNLSPRPLIPSLYDIKTQQFRSPGVGLEVIIGTDDDQIAVAPGALTNRWTKNNRNYFHYVTDGPIGNEWAIFSANYSMRKEQWKNPDSSEQVVTIQIFHDPRHTKNVDRILKSVRASLDYYTKQFGSYQHRHLTIVEHPGNGTGMHADPTMIIHAEGFSLWSPKDDTQSLDLPFAIVAHEMGHQWTVPYAFVEGAPVMSESIAWYYGMKAVENAKGFDQLKRLHSFMRQPYPYPPIRRGEPLLRGLDPYLSYRRGPFALYAMSEYLGEEYINKALRQMLEKHRPDSTSLATTLDLYGELQSVTPDSLKYMLHDLFEVNTYWNIETKKVTSMQKGDTWHVTLDVQASKTVYDSAGMETKVQLNDWIQVGVFGEAQKPLYLQMHRVQSGKQTFTIKVSGKPVRAGVDPYHLLTWEERERDNIVEVETEKN